MVGDMLFLNLNISVASTCKFLPVNGSDDHLIHCFKEGAPCATGAEILQQQMLVRRDLSLSENPFDNLDKDEDTEDFLLVDHSDDEDDFVDISNILFVKVYVYKSYCFFNTYGFIGRRISIPTISIRELPLWSHNKA